MQAPFAVVSFNQSINLLSLSLSLRHIQGDHSPDNVKFPDGSRHSAC